MYFVFQTVNMVYFLDISTVNTPKTELTHAPLLFPSNSTDLLLSQLLTLLCARPPAPMRNLRFSLSSPWPWIQATKSCLDFVPCLSLFCLPPVSSIQYNICQWEWETSKMKRESCYSLFMFHCFRVSLGVMFKLLTITCWTVLSLAYVSRFMSPHFTSPL